CNWGRPGKRIINFVLPINNKLHSDPLPKRKWTNAPKTRLGEKGNGKDRHLSGDHAWLFPTPNIDRGSRQEKMLDEAFGLVALDTLSKSRQARTITAISLWALRL